LLRQGHHHFDADEVDWIVYHWLPAAKQKRNMRNIPGGIRSAINRAERRMQL